MPSERHRNVMGDARMYRIPPGAHVEKITATKTHQGIDAFLLNDEFAVCNRCGIANPIACFMQVHETGCPVCGSQEMPVEKWADDSLREEAASWRDDLLREVDPNQLSFANDSWTGDPPTDRAALRDRALLAAAKLWHEKDSASQAPPPPPPPRPRRWKWF